MKLMQSKFSGFLLGLLGAMAYGLNPLFALPLYHDGFSPDAVLFLRYLPPVILLGIAIPLRGQSLKLSLHDLMLVIPAGLLFATSSLFLFLSYQKMDAGIASTILFVYPLMTALLMFLIFREKIGIFTWGSLLMALSGIALLYWKKDGSVLSMVGVVLVLLSSLTYAIYLILVNQTGLKNMPVLKMAFYGLASGVVLYSVRLLCGCGTMGHFHASSVCNIILLAMIPTMFSLICTTLSVQRIGATVTAILGAMEALTAVVVGVLVFHEDLTIRIVCGIALILGAVITMALTGNAKHS